MLFRIYKNEILTMYTAYKGGKYIAVQGSLSQRFANPLWLLGCIFSYRVPKVYERKDSQHVSKVTICGLVKERWPITFHTTPFYDTRLKTYEQSEIGVMSTIKKKKKKKTMKMS